MSTSYRAHGVWRALGLIRSTRAVAEMDWMDLLGKAGEEFLAETSPKSSSCIFQTFILVLR